MPELGQLTGMCASNVRSLIYKHGLKFRASRFRYPFEKIDWRLPNRVLMRIWQAKQTTISTKRPFYDAARQRYETGSEAYNAAIREQQRLAAAFLKHTPKPEHRTALPAYKGQRLTTKQWSLKLGIPASTICNRLEKGWPIAKVLGQRRYPLGRRSNAAA